MISGCSYASCNCTIIWVPINGSGCGVAGRCDCGCAELCCIRTQICAIVIDPVVVYSETVLCFVHFCGCSCIEIHSVARRCDCSERILSGMIVCSYSCQHISRCVGHCDHTIKLFLLAANCCYVVLCYVVGGNSVIGSYVGDSCTFWKRCGCSYIVQICVIMWRFKNSGCC